MTMEDLLRDAVRDLAAEARPATDLALTAMTRGRRLRRRRYAAMAAVVVALIGVAAVPYALLPHRADAPAPVAAAPVPWSEHPVALPGDWVVAGLGRGPGGPPDGSEPDGIVLLHRATGRYQVPSDPSPQDALGVQRVLAAPRGGLVAIDLSERIAVFDSNTGRTRWLEINGSSPQWSPDGRRLLFTTDNGYAIVDARSGASTRHAIDHSRFRCTACMFTWFPDGKQVALPIDDPGREPAEGAVDRPVRKGVQLFGADTGRATSPLPVRGDPIDSTAWSPDGKAVLVGDVELGDRQLVDVATGRVRRTIARPSGPMCFVAPDRLLIIDAHRARLVAAGTGVTMATADLPAEIHGNRVIAAPR